MHIKQKLPQATIDRIASLANPTLYAFYRDYLSNHGINSPTFYNAYQGKSLTLPTYVPLICALSRIPRMISISELRLLLQISPTNHRDLLLSAIEALRA